MQCFAEKLKRLISFFSLSCSFIHNKTHLKHTSRHILCSLLTFSVPMNTNSYFEEVESNSCICAHRLAKTQ